LPLPTPGGRIAPADILAARRRCGFQRVLIEGGAATISRVMENGCLDRLRAVVAPIRLGRGRPSLALPPIARADQALRMPMHVTALDDEILYDCDLSALSKG